MVSLKKKSQTDSLIKILSNNKNFILISIEKTKHQSLESLRKELKKTQALLKVIKNSLLEKAINKIKDVAFSQFRKQFFPLKKPTAILLLSKNWNQGLKTFFDYTKKVTTLAFKIGILDEQIYDKNYLEKIAQLPGKNELITNIISSLKSPVSKFVYALKFNTNKFVYILQEKTKEVKS